VGQEVEQEGFMAQCNNAAIVAIICSGSSKDSEVMHLVRCLAFTSAKFEFSLFTSHICGVHNVLADALSRNNAFLFLSNDPQAHRNACVIPQELTDLLMISKPD
jgi:hypothetical protein